MANSMKSFQLMGYGKALEEVVRPLPVPTGDQVLVRVQYSGLCHSDLHLIDENLDYGGGRKAPMAPLTFPRTLGHEPMGFVEAMGPDAAKTSGLQMGQPVVVYPWIGCGKCRMCTNDGGALEHLCSRPKTVGVMRDGSFSTHILLDNARYAVPTRGVPPMFAATCACSGLTAFSAVKRAGSIMADQSVVIIGAGGVGLSAIQIFKAMHPHHPGPIVCDIDSSKLDAARQHGATRTLLPDEIPQLAKEMRAKNAGGHGIQAVIDFVGSEKTFNAAMSLIQRGGNLVSVGMFGGSVDLPTVSLPLKGISMHGVYVGPLRDLHALLELLSKTNAQALPLQARPLKDINDAIRDFRTGRVVGRIILRTSEPAHL